MFVPRERSNDEKKPELQPATFHDIEQLDHQGYLQQKPSFSLYILGREAIVTKVDYPLVYWYFADDPSQTEKHRSYAASKHLFQKLATESTSQTQTQPLDDDFDVDWSAASNNTSTQELQQEEAIAVVDDEQTSSSGASADNNNTNNNADSNKQEQQQQQEPPQQLQSNRLNRSAGFMSAFMNRQQPLFIENKSDDELSLCPQPLQSIQINNCNNNSITINNKTTNITINNSNNNKLLVEEVVAASFCLIHSHGNEICFRHHNNQKQLVQTIQLDDVHGSAQEPDNKTLLKFPAFCFDDNNQINQNYSISFYWTNTTNTVLMAINNNEDVMHEDNKEQEEVVVASCELNYTVQQGAIEANDQQQQYKTTYSFDSATNTFIFQTMKVEREGPRGYLR